MWELTYEEALLVRNLTLGWCAFCLLFVALVIYLVFRTPQPEVATIPLEPTTYRG